jgi:hypothetical protein
MGRVCELHWLWFWFWLRKGGALETMVVTDPVGSTAWEEGQALHYSSLTEWLLSSAACRLLFLLSLLTQEMRHSCEFPLPSATLSNMVHSFSFLHSHSRHMQPTLIHLCIPKSFPSEKRMIGELLSSFLRLLDSWWIAGLVKVRFIQTD